MRMALVLSVNNNYYYYYYQQLIKPFSLHLLPYSNPNLGSLKFQTNHKYDSIFCTSIKSAHGQRRRALSIVHGLDKDGDQNTLQDDEVDNVGVKAALSMLRFYKREISPLMPNSCRYVPTCSEYSMIAYKKYGVVKGTILTAYRLCRCNPLGGSGFDPPRWFDETSPSDQ